ncbi:MAG: endo alpha-1,4 polygalactosaminidase [Solirubrobacteraceae bacterium]
MAIGRRSLRAAAALLVPLACLGATAGAGAATHWLPPPRMTFYWQLQGAIRMGEPVAAYDVDGFETSAAQVAALHGEGRRVICYVDVGTAERFRPDYRSFPKAVLGRSNGWPGERWLDIRKLGVLEPIMAKRFAMCAEKGFDAVEPDNIEAFSNRSGFPIAASDQLAFNEWVATAVHGLGMAVLQKNDGEQTPQLESYFDGALSEECNQFKECSSFAPYLQAGKPVLNAEYKLKTTRFCAADDAAGIVGARFGLALDGKRFEPCF